MNETDARRELTKQHEAAGLPRDKERAKAYQPTPAQIAEYQAKGLSGVALRKQYLQWAAAAAQAAQDGA